MVGRSNVGKSSLINALVRKKLARTSAAPGKTRLANFYRVAAEPRPPFYLVDLPGLRLRARRRRGARGVRRARGRRISARASNDPRFRGVFVLVDSRHPGLDSDRSTWNWLDSYGVERHVVATKVDKLTQCRTAASSRGTRTALLRSGHARLGGNR